jgi:uncharacterized protein (TIGR03437 family)
MRSLINGGAALACLLIALSGTTRAATFGSIVQIQGLVADIALDQGRGVVYAANFTANRIEVVSMSNLSLKSPMNVAEQPSTLALSPDGRYLVVGHYHFPDLATLSPPNQPCDPESPAFQVLTVIDLVNSGKQTRLDAGGACVLAVAFGNSPQALVVSTDGVRLLNPASGTLQVLTLLNSLSAPLPVPWATYPPNILKSSAGTSGDGNVIYALVDVAGGASGSSGPSEWQPSHVYAIGSTVLDPSGHIQTATVAGVSGATPPPWNDTGGASPDGTVTWQDTGVTASSIALRYEVATGKLTLLGATSDPPLGPRVVSVNQDGSRFLAGWALFDVNLAPGALVDFANFPYPPGIYNQGSLAFAPEPTLPCPANMQSNCMFVYAQVAAGTIQANLGAPPSAGPAASAPLLHVADPDNLTVREIYQLRENLGGKSLLTSDSKTIYSISDSGMTVFPVGSLQSVHRVKAVEQDLLFTATACTQGVVRQYVHITDPGGGQTDFSISAGASGVTGVTITPSAGTTPALVAIDVDITAFQAQKGTTVVPLQISSVQAVNVPFPVRLLINTRDPDQQGTVYDVPGTIVDILADPGRNRFYVIQQDQNLVLVYNATTFQQIAAPLMRTGNTPVQMAMTQDSNYLLVTNDNSQFASVFDLRTLQPSPPPILFPAGYFPRSIAVSSRAILATSRGVGPFTPAIGAPQVHLIDFANRVASPPATLGIYINTVDATGAVLGASPTGGTVFMAMPDGTVALYEAASDTCSPPLAGCGFVASRHDLSAVSGAYAALSDDLFAVDVHVLNAALVPIGQVNDMGNISSGAGVFSTAQNLGLLVSAPPGSPAGVIEKFDLTQLTAINPVRTVESPLLASAFTTAPVGQIGQTILPFSRTLALFPQQSIILLSTSGFTGLAWNYDATAAGPQPAVAAVESAADGSPAIAPGGLISIYGTGLSPSSESAGQIPLPDTLASACVSVNSEVIPLFYVSPTQINAQLPFDAAGGGSLVVRTPGGTSAAFALTVFPAAPTVFRDGTAGPITGLAAVFRANDNYSLVTLSNPIHPNDILVIFATGMGLTSPEPATGDVAPSNPLAVVSDVPVVTLGGAPLDLLYAGLAPAEVGVYQVNVEVPWSAPEGMQLPLTITQGGQSTNVQVRVVKP